MGTSDHETLPATGGSAAPRDAPPVTAGAEVGRYVVLERVGAGGMGVVYSAWDPELDRRIALKLLRPYAGGGSHASTSGGELPFQIIKVPGS